MNKHIFILAAILMIVMAGFNNCKKDDNDGDPGDGTENNPFKVANVEDLKRVGSGNEGPGGLKWERSKNYRQVADINLSGENWNPIRGGTPNSSGTTGWFSGSYDGGGYTISNLTIAGENYDVGLFGNVDGTIKNVRLNSVNISGRQNVGSVAGMLWTGGKIEHCSVNNIEIYAYSYFGGLVGIVYNNATVNACMVTNGTVTSNTASATQFLIGGIAGQNTNGTIKNCYTTVNVTGRQQVGGITGENGSNGTVQYCYATGDVASTTIEVGGIVGKNLGKTMNCVALNSLISKQSAGHLDVNNEPVIGRIIGFNHVSASITGTMNNNYARPDMTLTANAVTFLLGAEATLTGVHGANVSETDYTNGNADKWWNGTAGFPDSEWLFGASFLPRLKGFDRLMQDPTINNQRRNE